MDESIACKSWLRTATIDLWLKAERHAEVDIRDAVLEFLRLQRSDVVKQIRRIEKEKPGILADEHAADRIVNEIFDPRDWDEDLRSAIGPAIARTIVRGYLSSRAVQAGRRRRFPPVWRKGAKDIETKRAPDRDWSNAPLTEDEIHEIVSFDLPPSVTRSVFAHTKTIMDKPYWKDVNDTEKQRMQWSLQEGIEEGKTLRQIASDIQEDIGSDEVRAKRIAVTELTGSLNAGHVVSTEEAEDSGVQIAKTWVTIGDDKVRPDHEEADGQVVEGSDGLFDVGGEQAPYPGYADLSAGNRCNCRCTFIASPILEAEKSHYVQRGGKVFDVVYARLAREEWEAKLSKRFNVDQARDETGKWTSGGGEMLHSATRDKDGKWRTGDGKAAPEHIQKLGIPPAWTNVFVNKDPEGDMMARGNDTKGRLQVRYSDNHNMRAAADKFGRVSELRAKRAEIFKEVAKDAKSDDPQTKENAECLRLVMSTGIRPGSDRDTKAEKQAYGATTLKGEHVVVKGSEVRLRFTGKKGVDLDLPVADRDVAAMLRERAKAAGKDGKLFETDAETLRDYSKSKDGGGFKTKDHRTALGTETAVSVVKDHPPPATMKEYKMAIKEVATKVSEVLGNTPAIALKAYIDPNVFASWRSKVKA